MGLDEFAHFARLRAPWPCRSYTGDEDFSTADAVFDCIGDKGAPVQLARGRVESCADLGCAVHAAGWSAGSERFSLHDLTTPGAFWLTPMPPPSS